jgi:hypothetical protein
VGVGASARMAPAPARPSFLPRDRPRSAARCQVSRAPRGGSAAAPATAIGRCPVSYLTVRLTDCLRSAGGGGLPTAAEL